MILLDSNVVSALMRLHLEPAVRAWVARQDHEALFTSTPTIFEIRYGIERRPNGRQRRVLEMAYEQVVGSLLANRVLPFDAAAAREAAKARVLKIKNGSNVQVPDSQIAGVAIVHRATIATRNIRVFSGLDLVLTDPWA